MLLVTAASASERCSLDAVVPVEDSVEERVCSLFCRGRLRNGSSSGREGGRGDRGQCGIFDARSDSGRSAWCPWLLSGRHVFAICSGVTNNLLPKYFVW